MDVRVLRYFLAVAREESFSRAAQALYLSQPTLSRQIRELEEELGTELFVRSSRSVTLTRDGMRLRRRAQELVELMDRTREEFSGQAEEISGEVWIGCGETHAMAPLARVAVEIQIEHPGVRYRLYSGNAEDVSERLDKGLIDFGVVLDPADTQKYDALRIPGCDRWGLLMPEGHPLSKKSEISPEDLEGVRLLTSRQTASAGGLADWLGARADALDVAATFNLIFNAAVMVREGMGCALCLDHLVDAQAHSGLCFRPLAPRVEVGWNLIWKKYQLFSPAAELFLSRARAAFSGEA